MYPQITAAIPEIVLDEIILKYRDKPGMLLSTLEEVQEINPLKFLSKETLSVVSRKLNVPYTQVYSVATFYSFFNLKPQGKHSIIVCRGTACHTKGSKALLNEVGPILGLGTEEIEIDPSFTTPDNLFTIKTVACFGQCAQSPVVAVDGIMYSNVNSQKLLKILKKVKSNPNA
ncbi:MAG: NAD(P)H-dependent oxidoreductase subunit E [Paludibacter sp.]|jgi:NADH-quinone oxidoreductase subunit E|nr:NAD(P)H-dependent oxidoreductase subunit E [Paludibacter sp.]